MRPGGTAEGCNSAILRDCRLILCRRIFLVADRLDYPLGFPETAKTAVELAIVDADHEFYEGPPLRPRVPLIVGPSTIVSVAKPMRCTVKSNWTPRGGITTVVTCNYPDSKV